MSDRVIAWAELTAAAKAWAHEDSKLTRQELSDAAKAWASIEAPRAPSSSGGEGWTFRFGKNAGKTPRDVDVRDLRWYEKVFLESIDNPEKERFRENNQKSLDVVRAELRRRGEAADY